MDESGDARAPRQTGVVIQSREGGCYRIPFAELADYSVAEGTVVVEWRPGRYLVVPPDRLDTYRMSDEELLPLMLEARTRGRGRPGVRRRRVRVPRGRRF